MNDTHYRKPEFDDLRERLNKEILRRRTFKWWDNLATPEIGQDRTSPINDKSFTINNPSTGAKVTGHGVPEISGFSSYTNSLAGPIRNAPENPKHAEGHGDNPANDLYTSSVNFDYDEARNFLHGLSKMHDIDLFYGLDEIPSLAFRDSQDVEDKTVWAESDIKTRERISSQQIIDKKHDPLGNTGKPIRSTGPNTPWTGSYDTANYPRPQTSSTLVNYPSILPSGETDGDQDPVSKTNFYDDYTPGPSNANFSSTKNATPANPGSPASYDNSRPRSTSNSLQIPNGIANYNPAGMTNMPGSHNFHPYNPNLVPSPSMEATGPTLDDHGNFEFTPGPGPSQNPDYPLDLNPTEPLPYPVPKVTSGSRFGANPRNPSWSASGDHNAGTSRKPVSKLDNEFRPRKSYEGSPVTITGSGKLCHTACTGLCYLTCHDSCSEACDRTCWSRCGDACVSTCGNVCTGCNTLCYTSCLTKCQQTTGYACQYNGSIAKNPITSRGTPIKNNSNSKLGNTVKNPENKATYQYRHCANTCQWTCEFYPNYKTQCWDTACMSLCVTTCRETCLNTCYGGCINNPNQHNSFFSSSKGQGCSSECTADCAGECYSAGCADMCTSCSGSCDDTCDSGCASSCESSCGGNCSDDCDHSCGSSGDDDVLKPEKPLEGEGGEGGGEG